MFDSKRRKDRTIIAEEKNTEHHDSYTELMNEIVFSFMMLIEHVITDLLFLCNICICLMLAPNEITCKVIKNVFNAPYQHKQLLLEGQDKQSETPCASKSYEQTQATPLKRKATVSAAEGRS